MSTHSTIQIRSVWEASNQGMSSTIAKGGESDDAEKETGMRIFFKATSRRLTHLSSR